VKLPGHGERKMKKFWTFAPWLTRLILLPPTIIFALIAARYLMHPVASAAAQGIVLPPGLGVTIARVGFGGFPLGCATFLITCLLSRRRLLTGLTFVAIMVVVLLLVRVFGMTADSTVRENMKLVNAEIALTLVTAIGIFVERRRRAYFLHKHDSGSG
jgi:hypothetical protein